MHSTPETDVDDMMVLLVDTPSQAFRETIRDIVEHVPAIVEARQSKLTDDAIDALVSVYMRTPPNADVKWLLYDSNAKARARFFGEWPSFTSEDLADAAGHVPKNKSMTASRWKMKGKVFSIKHGGVEYFPAFQFEEGQPIEAVAKVLTLLDEKKSGWQLAFWFTSANGWLAGKRPVDVLKDDDAVVLAAAREAENIAGGFPCLHPPSPPRTLTRSRRGRGSTEFMISVSEAALSILERVASAGLRRYSWAAILSQRNISRPTTNAQFMRRFFTTCQLTR